MSREAEEERRDRRARDGALEAPANVRRGERIPRRPADAMAQLEDVVAVRERPPARREVRDDRAVRRQDRRGPGRGGRRADELAHPVRGGSGSRRHPACPSRRGSRAARRRDRRMYGCRRSSRHACRRRSAAMTSAASAASTTPAARRLDAAPDTARESTARRATEWGAACAPPVEHVLVWASAPRHAERRASARPSTRRSSGTSSATSRRVSLS